LYYPDIEQGKRPKLSIIENIPKLKRKEKLIYKSSEPWTQHDDLVFLKYCVLPNNEISVIMLYDVEVIEFFLRFMA
jgi:hypothetical protein